MPEPTQDEINRLVKLLPALEKMVQTEERMAWLWSSLRIWSGYLLAIMAFLVATKSYIIQLFLSNGGAK